MNLIGRIVSIKKEIDELSYDELVELRDHFNQNNNDITTNKLENKNKQKDYKETKRSNMFFIFHQNLESSLINYSRATMLLKNSQNLDDAYNHAYVDSSICLFLLNKRYKKMNKKRRY